MAAKVASAPVLVELGWVVARHGDEPVRRQLLYLPDEPAIVVPHRIDGKRWVCEILAGRTHPRTGQRASYSTATIACARTRILVDPAGSGTFLLLWQARIAQRWPVGPLPVLGRALAARTHPDDRRRIDLSPESMLALAQSTRLPAHAVRRGLDRLAEAGLTARVGATLTQWTLTLPDLDPAGTSRRPAATP